MANRVYKVIANSAAAKFHESKAKIKVYAGGFANGKTTALIAEALKIARDYPGSVGMLGAATYSELEKTVLREFEKWCPPAWIKSFPKSNGAPVCTMHNGSVIDFRYVARREGEETGTGSSHLLSSNYDWIGVDQIEKPEITHSDFEHLMGRLRGAAEYVGDDASMPRTGPRWLLLTANPALGWFYKHVVKPRQDFDRGINNPLLICENDEDGERVLDVNGNPQPIIELFEATTFDNAQNLEPDYLKGLLATYSGRMRDRFIYGKWIAFEGVVYSDVYDSNVHMVPQQFMLHYLSQMRAQGYQLEMIEGYDFGMAVPSCYGLGLVDADGAIHIVDGFYEKEKSIEWQSDEIKRLRTLHASIEMMQLALPPSVNADPQIFKRTNAGMQTIGVTTADMFREQGIEMQRGNNAKLNGIIKVKQYLMMQQSKINPYTGAFGCPKMFIADTLHWLGEEFETWRWKQNRDEGSFDDTVDVNDHGMDMVKYMTSKPPPAGRLVGRRTFDLAQVAKWAESDIRAEPTNTRKHRYAS